MSISRQELYRHGEPFGDSATRRKLGGGYICGGGGGKSSSQSSNATTNVDKRNAVQDGIGISGDGNAISTTTNTTITDGGIVSRALDSIDKSDALQSEGFGQLLEAAGQMFTSTLGTLEKSNVQVATAYQTANTDAAGKLDNKTIVVLAVAGAAALAFASRK